MQRYLRLLFLLLIAASAPLARAAAVPVAAQGDSIVSENLADSGNSQAFNAEQAPNGGATVNSEVPEGSAVREASADSIASGDAAATEASEDEEYVSLHEYAEAERAKAAGADTIVPFWEREFKPDPQKAVWFSAVLPGLGQIYNRQYWKLPIIIGGAAGLAYGITWNNQMYIDYRKAYVDLIDSDPDTRGYEKLLPAGVTINSSNTATYQRTFQNQMENYLRYRDLCIIAAGAVYVLVIIDAYVDAHLHDYDISDDLSVKIAPAVIPSERNSYDASVGVRCKLRF